ncbi:Ribonuclease P protein subunit p30, partial [Entophlyctis luteolus]
LASDPEIRRKRDSLAPEVSQAAPSSEFRIIKRLTIILNDSSLQLSAGALSSAFDVLAVAPTTEKAFQHAVLHSEVDIISLDLGTKLPFYIKKTTVNTAIQRGIYFELCYAQSIRDATARKNAIANMQQYVRATGGKNLVISSDAIKALDVRSPHDVANVARVVFGVPDRYAREAARAACRAVLFHAATRRDTMKGLVSAEPVSVLSDAVKWKLGDAPTEEEMNADFVAFGADASDMDE